MPAWHAHDLAFGGRTQTHIPQDMAGPFAWTKTHTHRFIAARPQRGPSPSQITPRPSFGIWPVESYSERANPFAHAEAPKGSPRNFSRVHPVLRLKDARSSPLAHGERRTGFRLNFSLSPLPSAGAVTPTKSSVNYCPPTPGQGEGTAPGDGDSADAAPGRCGWDRPAELFSF